MRTSYLLLIALLTGTTLIAQKREEGFDFNFKPTQYAPFYYVITEKKDSGWHREAYFMTERTMAMEGWYKDSVGKIAHGVMTWYHPTRYPKSKGHYVDGQKEGAWLEYDEKGHLIDSAFFIKGQQRGVRLSWNAEGYLVDSAYFDNQGNGVEVSWYKGGRLRSTGRWLQDSLRHGRWQHFHENGKLMASIDYVNGKETTYACYTEAGEPLDVKECELKEAAFPGGDAAWRRFLQNNLNAAVPVNNGAPAGQYTAMIQFIVDKDGTLSDIKALTRYGYGMEEEVIRMLKQSANWIPAQLYGRKVKAYRRQPITFVVYEETRKKRR